MSLALDGCFASTQLDANDARWGVLLRKLPKRFHFVTCPSGPMIVFLCHALLPIANRASRETISSSSRFGITSPFRGGRRVLRKRDADHLDQKIDQISDQLPESAGAFLRRLKTPSSRWMRLPLALLLIVGGVAGFLPVLGFWMIPLGLLFAGTGRAIVSGTHIAVADGV
jgi:hypothetical protein